MPFHRPALVLIAGTTGLLLALTFVQAMSNGRPLGLPPETAAQSEFQACLNVINSRDFGEIRRFAESHFSKGLREKGMAETLARLSFESTGFVWQGTRESSPRRFVGILKNKLQETWLDFGVFVSKEAPFMIEGLILSPSGPPAGTLPPPKLSDTEIVEKLKTTGKAYEDAGIFSGTVLLARGSDLLFAEAYGPADRESRVPASLETRFNIASLGKMFTAVAIAQLADEGRLSLDDRVGRFLETDWIRKQTAESVTIRHLLTHTSGLGDFFEKAKSSRRAEFLTLEDYRPLIALETLSFTPGSRFLYSNSGFFLLGVIVEKITGQPYEDYLRTKIFTPAGMNGMAFESEIDEKGAPRPGFALNYILDFSEDRVLWKQPPWAGIRMKGTPAGGAKATIRDIWKFAHAFMENKLVRQEMRDLMIKAKPEMNAPGYGYGFEVGRGPAGSVVGHRGGDRGMTALLHVYPDRGLIFIVLSNTSNGTFLMNSRFVEGLTGEHFRLQPEPKKSFDF